MAFQGEVIIRKEMFHEKEMELLKWKALKASLFIYASGIHAIKLENELGYITILPYKGHQSGMQFFMVEVLKCSQNLMNQKMLNQ